MVVIIVFYVMLLYVLSPKLADLICLKKKATFFHAFT